MWLRSPLLLLLLPLALLTINAGCAHGQDEVVPHEFVPLEQQSNFTIDDAIRKNNNATVQKAEQAKAQVPTVAPLSETPESSGKKGNETSGNGQEEVTKSTEEPSTTTDEGTTTQEENETTPPTPDASKATPATEKPPAAPTQPTVKPTEKSTEKPAEKPTTKSTTMEPKPSTEKSAEPDPDENLASSGTVALIMAIAFAITVIIVYFGLLGWRRYLEWRYGNRELLVNDLEFDTSDLRHFEL